MQPASPVGNMTTRKRQTPKRMSWEGELNFLHPQTFSQCEFFRCHNQEVWLRAIKPWWGFQFGSPQTVTNVDFEGISTICTFLGGASALPVAAADSAGEC